MGFYNFSLPALVIYLSNGTAGTSRKPASTYIETTIGGIMYAQVDRPLKEFSYPYAFFLNQYENCTTKNTDDLIADLKKAYQNPAFSEENEKLLENWSKKLSSSENIYDRHCLRTLLSEYNTVCENYSTESLQQRENTLDFLRLCLFQREFPLLDIFAAYDLTPFHQITEQQKQTITGDIDWGNQDDEVISNRLIDTAIHVVKYYITDMQRYRLYLYRCKKCGQLFVRRDRKASALCQGSICEQYPEETPMQRYYRNNELFPYKKERRNLSQYLSNIKKSGILSEQLIAQIRRESDEQKKRVEAGRLQSEKYIEWLKEKHIECVALSAKNRAKK